MDTYIRNRTQKTRNTSFLSDDDADSRYSDNTILLKDDDYTGTIDKEGFIVRKVWITKEEKVSSN